MSSHTTLTTATPPRRAAILVMPALLAGTLLAGGAAQAATPFEIADIFFELNSTARDLGVHVSLDGESWKSLRVQDPRGREVVELEPKRGFKNIGLTELFFEGSEPPLVDVSFARFLELFPQGNYRFLGVTTGNQLLRSTDPLTPELPCPVKVVSPPPNKPVAPDQVVIRWEPAPGVFNPDSGICRKNQDVELVRYEVIAEIVNETTDLLRHYTVELSAGAIELPVPRVFIEEGLGSTGTEFKLEVIAIEDTGNKTITAALLTGMLHAASLAGGNRTWLQLWAGHRDRGVGSTKRWQAVLTMSCELELLLGRPYDLPGCAASADP